MGIQGITVRLLSGAIAATVVGLLPGTSFACGADPYIGEICVFATPYCPQGYLPADGREMQLRSNQALYSLMGTRFGGDGKTTFNLPDLRVQAASVPAGSGPDKPNLKVVWANGLLSCIVVQGMYPVRPD